MATQISRLSRLIDSFCNAPGAERNLYDGLKRLLTEPSAPVQCDGASIVIDSPIPKTRCSPDLTLYLLGENGRPVVSASHVFASIEVKRGSYLLDHEEEVIADKAKYVTSTTRFLYLVDQSVVLRFSILPGGAFGRRDSWLWQDLKIPENYDVAFNPISSNHARVTSAIAAFQRGETGFAYAEVTEETRQEFIDSVRVGAVVIREAVQKIISETVVAQVREARDALDSLSSLWGQWRLTWTDSPLPTVEYDNDKNLSNQEQLDYENAIDQLLLIIEPLTPSLKLETAVLPRTAQRMGFENPVSVLSPQKDSKGKLTESGKAVESLGYETSSMILSRMLMVRFSEDHGLLTRYICNGGIEQFTKYAEHFNIGAQGLLREVYRKARPLYSSVFAVDPLDWAVLGDEAVLSNALLHSMWLLSRWDFRTVKGDILSGVYDKYLDLTKRRALGEVYTRPEICRYMLEKCTPIAMSSVLDPACGSGTFLVEYLHSQLERLRGAGALNADAIQSVLQRISGLDLNPFSATLTQIQILWQLLDVFADQSPERQREIAKQLVPHIMIEGGHSSLDSFEHAMEAHTTGELDLSQGQTGGRRHSGLNGAMIRRRLKAISTGRYDVVVANPPYVRAHRRTIDDRTRAAYSRIMDGQVDLYCMFLYRTLRSWLVPGGRTAFIIPIAVLEADYAASLREVLNEYRLIEIVDLEPLRKLTFRGIKKQTVILILENTPASEDDQVRVAIAGTECYDAATDSIDLNLATASTLPRRSLNVAGYFGNPLQRAEEV